MKPTVGLTSRAGIIPMTPLWDTVGPICRNVTDAVYMLDVIVGSDPRDEVTTEAAKYIPEDGYKQFLKEDGLKGKQIGIVKHPFVEMIHGAIEKSAFEHHLDLLRYGSVLPQSHLFICKITNKNKSSFLVCLICNYLVDSMLEFETRRSNSGRQPEHTTY